MLALLIYVALLAIGIRKPYWSILCFIYLYGT